MASKDLDSPMDTHLGGKKRADKGGDKGGVFDKNPTPVVSHPRDMDRPGACAPDRGGDDGRVRGMAYA